MTKRALKAKRSAAARKGWETRKRRLAATVCRVAREMEAQRFKLNRKLLSEKRAEIKTAKFIAPAMEASGRQRRMVLLSQSDDGATSVWGPPPDANPWPRLAAMVRRCWGAVASIWRP